MKKRFYLAVLFAVLQGTLAFAHPDHAKLDKSSTFEILENPKSIIEYEGTQFKFSQSLLLRNLQVTLDLLERDLATEISGNKISADKIEIRLKAMALCIIAAGELGSDVPELQTLLSRASDLVGSRFIPADVNWPETIMKGAAAMAFESSSGETIDTHALIDKSRITFLDFISTAKHKLDKRSGN